MRYLIVGAIIGFACTNGPDKHVVARAHDCAERKTDERPAPAYEVRECLAIHITKAKGGKPQDHYDEASKLMLNYYMNKFNGYYNGR